MRRAVLMQQDELKRLLDHRTGPEPSVTPEGCRHPLRRSGSIGPEPLFKSAAWAPRGCFIPISCWFLISKEEEQLQFFIGGDVARENLDSVQSVTGCLMFVPHPQWDVCPH